MDWLRHAKKWAENGMNPNEMYTMPFSRLYAVFFHQPPEESKPVIENVEDLRELRNERRKRMGLPLIPSKPKG